jgi:DNA invertase Pin-like site-specific DNA recombinase
VLRVIARRAAPSESTRLGRSLQNPISFQLELQSKRVELYLHQQALDISTPMGKAMFQLCGVFAELERSIIQELVLAGLERARAKGKILGRPRTDPRVEDKIRKLAGRGMGKGKIARTLGIGVSVAQRVLAS